MDDRYDEMGYELEEDEEEYDEGYEERLAEIEKNMENMRGTLNEDKQRESLGHNAFSRKLGPPEPFTEDRIISSEEVGKMVIDETKLEGEKSDDKESNILDEELSFERINPDGQFEKLSEEEFKEALKEDTLVEGSIEDVKLENEIRNENSLEGVEVYETYDQPELVREWEEMYHSEKEEVLSDEALAQLQQSMDSMAGLDSVIETVGDEPISYEAPGDINSDSYSELDSEMDLEQDEDLDSDMDIDGGYGSNI